MSEARRARPTLRCLADDLSVDLPGLAVDLGELDHPFMDELRRVAPTSPAGQKRILSIDHPLVFRIRVSTGRGATWLNDERNIVWLCAVHRREQDSDDDAYAHFSELHASDRLLPDHDDDLRDLGDWLPCRTLVRHDDGIQEIWCALSVRGTDDTFIPEAVRDLLFAALEAHIAPALFEVRNDWLTGTAEWFEVVRLGLR